MTSNKTLEQKLKRGKNVNVVIRKPNVFTEDKKGENNKFPPLSDYLGNMLKEPRMTYSWDFSKYLFSIIFRKVLNVRFLFVSLII